MTKCNRRTICAFTKAGDTLLFTATIALGTTTLGYRAIAGAYPNNAAAQAKAANATSARTTSAWKTMHPFTPLKKTSTTTGGAANRRAESAGPTAARRRRGS